MELVSSSVKCNQCNCQTIPIYQKEEEVWLCTACAPVKRPCNNITRGCTYTDHIDKCEKHELYYCQYSNQCQICKKTVTSTLDEHYAQAHADITYRAGTEFNVGFGQQWCIISTDFGNVICHCNVYESVFVLELYTPVPSEELYLYKCLVQFQHEPSEFAVTRSANVEYNLNNDWYLHLTSYEFITYINFCNATYNIKIHLIKN